jgi:hypothetical protein
MERRRLRMSIRAMAKKTGCTIYAFVSRRAAGVWTNLPSLTYALLDPLPPPNAVIWADFGMRYEMFNHFRIDAYGFSPNGTILQLMASKAAGQTVSAVDLTTYDQVVCGIERQLSEKALSRIQGDRILEYRNTVAHRAKGGEKIYMLPWHTPLVPPKLLANSVDIQLLEAVMVDLLEQLRPRFVFLTWEGQPEARLFRPKLREDSLLRWGLNESHRIISLVRFDSEERFRDSVSIPALLGEDQVHCEKLRLVLTRAIQRPRSNVAAYRHVIGQLPFAAFVGQAVNAGRIPIIDTWYRKETQDITTGEIEYLDAVTTLAQKLLESDCDK